MFNKILKSENLLTKNESFYLKSMNLITSYVNAPAYKICKYLNKVLYEFFHPKHSVKNSIELVNSLNKIQANNSYKLISFDVKNLFPSIPITDLKNIIVNFLNSNIPDSKKRSDILKLIDPCLDQNYFLFNNTIYRQNNGLPMGSPLSPLLAEIYMSHFEDTILNSENKFFDPIKFWKRYVDDILVVWSGSVRQLNAFNEKLNSINPKIQFTTEIGNKSIPFLDLRISIINNHLEYQIYRKPTFTDTIIPYDSNHPLNTKLSVFYSMFNRLENIPLTSEHYNHELAIIHKISDNNNYPRHLIDNIQKKVIYKITAPLLYSIIPTKEKNFKKLYFHSPLSYPIANMFRKLNITPAFYNRNNLSSILVNNKIDIIKPTTMSGVYKLQCNDCQSFYIGQTGRSFNQRHVEHMRSLRNLQVNSLNPNAPPLSYTSAFADHLFDHNHSPSSTNPLPLHFIPKSRKLDLLESAEIKKAIHLNQNILNNQTDIKTSPIIDILINDI